MTFTFSEKWTALECELKAQVERDNCELQIPSKYVHNFIPKGPVDYVLIAMEPSTGVPARKRVRPSKGVQEQSVPVDEGITQIDRNFSWSTEDFILHYCLREYLCQSGETYHLTDLAKGGMKTKFAHKERTQRYERWFPLLQKELALLNKPGETRIIAIGKVVGDFLKDKNSDKSLCDRVARVLHYSRQAARHVYKAIEPLIADFPEFSQTIEREALEKSMKKVLIKGDMDSYISKRPEGGKPFKLTPFRRKLMFYYKNMFIELRDSSDIVLKLPS